MMLDGIVETLRREIPLPAPECALQDGIVAVNRANRERRAAAQVIERFALTDEEREAVGRAARIAESCEAMEELTADDADALLGLLERLGGGR